MEDAGNAIYSLIVSELGIDKKYVVIADTGRGGDALVVARGLFSWGSPI